MAKELGEAEHQILGDLRVELHRSPSRFGVELYLLATNNSGDTTHQATFIDPRGIPWFTPYAPGTVGSPLMHLSERALAAFQKAFAELPAPTDDGVRAHLADAVRIRDRLLTIVEYARDPNYPKED
jgi:hypothetical protein